MPHVMPSTAVVFTIVSLVLAIALPARASEQDALAISANIQQLHMPHGTIIDPMFLSGNPQDSGYNTIDRYTHGGDSAIWTGHYLAAEAFRFQVTGEPQAFDNLWTALRGIRALVDVTGSNLLARCLVPVAWEENVNKRGIITEEHENGIYTSTIGGQAYYWVGNTTRDQYAGVFFGLGVAYDMVNNAEVRSFIQQDVTRLLDFLLQNDWAVRMPGGEISTVFIGRPDQQLSFLEVGRRVNPARFDSLYQSYRSTYATLVIAPISVEVSDPYNAYFKFNLDSITLYNLIRLEGNSYYRWWYENAYDVLRHTTDDHRNAHFNMIDRGLTGPNSSRDAETRALLDAWLLRPRRDYAVDWGGTYAACGENRACQPIPVADRVRTDFLWQRSPFQLYGGGEGKIETAGIDYILPYWMARYYGVVDFTPGAKLTLTLNQATFQKGEQLILNAAVTPGPSPVDVYIALQLPGCTAPACFFFWQGGLNFTMTPQPLLRNWLISPFNGPIFSYTFGGTELVGSYVWLGAFTVPGTLNLLGEITQAPCTFGP